MCAIFQTMRRMPNRLTRQLNLFQPQYEFTQEIYPGQDCGLLFSKPDQTEVEWRSVKFGMVPKWAKNLDICKATYNARTETVAQKPSFKHAWSQGQFALIPVDLIYEPRYINGQAQRWGIFRQDREAFSIAAIYENAIINGQQIRSMSMLTINADQHPLMSQFHQPQDEKRSIIVIPEHLRHDWLHCKPHQAPEFFQGLSDEFTAEYMPPVTVSDLQNRLDL